jgi:hypothetical protein
MRNRKTLIALSTAIVLGVFGASSLAYANDPTDSYGGFKIGPMGQTMGSPSDWGARGAPAGATAYGFASPSQAQHATHKHTQVR